MEHQIIIRAVYNDYCDQIQQLILPIQQIEFNVPVTLEAQPDLFDIEANYHKEGGGFWAALDEARPEGNQLVGTIGLINAGKQIGVIRKMFVKKEYRGKEIGIGQELLATLISYCKAQGINDIYLGTVEILKGAHRFYEKNGFQEIGVADLPAVFPRMMADNKFYHLRLQEAILNTKG
ncbi:MAG TPA: GNAT family N-acetyltransferase [Pedobacter sp.]|nr:GNAT family N-acetyltransferase [Pedobacter sp.]